MPLRALMPALVLLACACAGAAPSQPQAMPQERQSSSELAGRYLSNVAPDTPGVHRLSELFCASGDWFSFGGPAIERGHYTVEGERVCVSQAGMNQASCRILTPSGPGQVISRRIGADGSYTPPVVLFLHDGPLDICPSR